MGASGLMAPLSAPHRRVFDPFWRKERLRANDLIGIKLREGRQREAQSEIIESRKTKSRDPREGANDEQCITVCRALTRDPARASGDLGTRNRLCEKEARDQWSRFCSDADFCLVARPTDQPGWADPSLRASRGPDKCLWLDATFYKR